MGCLKRRYYIGLSASFHDSSLAIVDPEGEVVFAEATERYLQDKRAWNAVPDHLLRMPGLIARYCAPDAELVGAVSWSDRMVRLVQLGVINEFMPFRKLGERVAAMLESYFEAWPFPGPKVIQAWGRHSIVFAGTNLDAHRSITNTVQLRRYNHHLTHAVYACASSPFDRAACAVIDGFGEGVSTSFFAYRDGVVEAVPVEPCIDSTSLGMFYMLVCNLCGFDWMQGEEWKVMGLAPYGKVDRALYDQLKPLVRVRGRKLNMVAATRERRAITDAVRRRFQRSPSSPPSAAADIACTGQQLFADAMRELLQGLVDRDISRNLVLTGGCALNSSWNGRILSEVPFAQLHVPSAPGDDGNSIGAALHAFNQDQPERRRAARLLSPYLGSGIDPESQAFLLKFNAGQRVRRCDNAPEVAAELLARGKIIGWMQGRAEFGPRALGHRSILADPRSPEMKDRINARVKFREEYRPFAPSILHEFGPEYFENYQMSPYMERTLMFREEVRSKVPAVVHVDNTGRLQSVTAELCPTYHRLIRAFYELTGVPLILNTSFNIMGKPIIHTVQDALGMFYTCGLDALVIGDIVIEKEEAGSP